MSNRNIEALNLKIEKSGLNRDSGEEDKNIKIKNIFLLFFY